MYFRRFIYTKVHYKKSENHDKTIVQLASFIFPVNYFKKEKFVFNKMFLDYGIVIVSKNIIAILLSN